LINSWSQKDVDVVRHDGEAVEEKFALVAIAEECRDEKVCVRCALEVAMLKMSGDCEGVRAGLLSDRSLGS
jgi:hypothetical protein